MASPNLSAFTTAQIICLFPVAAPTAHAGFRVEDQGNLMAAELRMVCDAVIRLPLPWFRACEAVRRRCIWDGRRRD